MSRAHFSRKVADDQGNVVPGTTVTVYEAGTLTPLTDPLYVNETGSVEQTNPFEVNDGIVDFYVDSPRQIKVGLRAPNGVERFFDNQDVYPDPQTVVEAPFGLQITNIPQAGQFLQAIGSQRATWVNQEELVTAALTPVTNLVTHTFSASTLGPFTLRNANGTAATPSYVDVALETKPPGFTFTKALDWSAAQAQILSTVTLLLTEPGTVQFVYKVIEPAEGATPGVLRASADDGALWVKTATDADEYGVWRIGYLIGVPLGSHRLHFHHTPGTDPAARVLLGSVVISTGGSVPAHAHEGGGLLSTALGAGASANFEGATALGGESVVSGTRGTAVGAHASADQGGTALGAYAAAADYAVAVGYEARTHPLATSAVALGHNASAQAPGAVVVGPSAIGSDDSAVALGKNALAALNAVAVGRDATATGDSSVAIGYGSDASHARSVALGEGATTTADDQVVLGTDTHTTIVPGNLAHHGDAVIGASSSTVGFFGEPGTTQPVVSGSRGGNAVLGALITHLANLGLIDDQTTA